MKANLTVLLALVVFALPAAAQDASVEEIVAAHVEARGGMETLTDINTLRMVGTANMQGMEIPVDLRYKRPGKFLQTVQVMDQEIMQGTDGSTAWMLNPMMGPDPIVAPDGAAAQVSQQADFIGPLVDAESKGFTLAYAGTEAVGDVEAIKITAAHEELPTTTYFLHPETYMIIQNVVEGPNPQTGQPTTIVTTFDDYREVAGSVFPYQMMMTTDGQPFQTVVFESVTANETMSNDLFVMPSPLGID